MWSKFANSRFFTRWIATLAILFSPGFLISTVITCVTLYFSITHRDNVAFSNVMAILGSIFGAIAGAFFKDEYDNMSGKNILEKKGRSALRNLEGINTQLGNIKVWVLEFIKKTGKQEDKRTLEEINRHIATIELSINSGLEDWVDIVPELKERNQKGLEIDKKYKDLFQTYLTELVQQRKELVISTDAQKVEEVKKKISDLEKQIKDLKKERSQAISGIAFDSGNPMFIPSSGSQSFLGTIDALRPCTSCGKYFVPTRFDPATGLPVAASVDCPECTEGRNKAKSAKKKKN